MLLSQCLYVSQIYTGWTGMPQKKGPCWLEMVIQQGLVSLLSWGASGEGYGEEAEKALIAGILPLHRVV